MRFTVSTKPFSDGLNLAIVNSNVSKFSQKSNIAQVSVSNNQLVVNLECDNVKTEIRFKGGIDGDVSDKIATVSCLVLKQIVSTFDSAVTTVEFDENGLILYSGKSKFVVPDIIKNTDMELNKPRYNVGGSDIRQIDKASWKFIDDHQMFAISMSFVNPIYTRCWIGDTTDVLVGDMDNSIFSHSNKGTLGETCLLRSDIINMFVSLPEDATLSNIGDAYLVHTKNDCYEMYSEVTPEHEDDPNLGSYNADIIMDMMKTDMSKAVKINTSSILKTLNQSDLLSTEDKSAKAVFINVDSNVLTVSDDNVDCKVDVEGSSGISYNIKMKASNFKSAISNIDSESVFIAPVTNGETDEIVGLILWTDNMSTLVAGADQ